MQNTYQFIDYLNFESDDNLHFKVKIFVAYFILLCQFDVTLKLRGLVLYVKL